ncbi:MAG: COG1361 S-layer family protein, partial [Bacillota bacterium]
PVKNDSIYQARNITVTLKMADETKAPFVLEDFDLRQKVDYINGNETKDISFIIRTLSSAPEGLYPMKLNYDYDNAYNDHFTASETVYIRVKNDNVNPRLTVESISVKEADASIGTIDLEINIKNLGNLPARDVRIALRGLRSGGYTAYNTTDVRYVNKIEGRGSATVSYRLLAPANAAAGANELSVKMDYADSVGNTYSEENQVFVPASGSESARPGIVFEKIVSPQTALEPGRDFEISADIKNNGGAAKNIKITLSSDQGIITKSMNPIYLEKLDASSVQNISFKLFTMDDVATRNYPVSLNIEYEDALGNKYNATQYVGVFIENNEGKTVPRIIIDNYSMDPFPVNAGEDFKLKMSFLNTSKTVDVSNIKVTVTSDDGTFTPVDSGNTFYLESIPSGQNVEREIMLHVKPDAEQKSYMLSVNFEYEDSKGNPYTAKETMSVRVLQNPRLVVSDINLMPEAYVGQPVSVYLDFYNMGKSTLYNLMVKVEGDFQGQGLSYYVGNFEPGRTDFFDASFTPMNPGMQTGSILFTFEDANGKISEIRKEFTLNVMEMQMEAPIVDENGMPVGKGMIKPGMEGMPGGPKKTNIIVYAIPAAAVIIIGFIVFFILRKRHIRRKELSLDE